MSDPAAQVNDAGPGPNRLLWILFASYFAFGIILNVVGVIIPVLIKQYHLSFFVGGLLAFAFYISFGVCSIPAGLVADRIGPRPVVLSGVFLMGAGCGAIPWAHNYASITLLAFFIGSGIALLQTAGNPLIERLDRPQNYHRNLTLTIGFCGIGAFAGPFCLSFLQAHGQPWQRLYMGFAVLCAVQLALLFRSSFPRKPIESGEKIQLLAVLKLLRHPIAITYALAIFFYVGGEVGTASWIVKFFEQIHGVRAETLDAANRSFSSVGWPPLPVLTVSLFWGLQGVGRLISGPAIRQLGPRSTLRLSALATVICLLLAILGSTKVTALGFAGCGFFTSVLFTLLFSGAIHSFHQSQGALAGLLITASIGGAIVPPLVGLAGDHFGLQVAMMIPALCFAYVLVVSWVGKATYE